VGANVIGFPEVEIGEGILASVATVVLVGGLTSSLSGDVAKTKNNPTILYHYTNAAGLAGILSTLVINPSLLTNNPNDARYGDGQYFTDILPGTRSNASLSATFLGNPFQGNKYSNFVAVDVTSLNVILGRPNVYVVPNDLPLDISTRLVGSGSNQ